MELKQKQHIFHTKNNLYRICLNEWKIRNKFKIERKNGIRSYGKRKNFQQTKAILNFLTAMIKIADNHDMVHFGGFMKVYNFVTKGGKPLEFVDTNRG